MQVRSGLKALPWARLSSVLAVVTLAGSQVVFTLILENRGHFPYHAAFHLWVVAWFLLLPLVVLFACDAGLEKVGRGNGRTFQIWRAGIYAAVVVSMIHQARVYYPGVFGFAASSAVAIPIYLVFGGGVVALALRFPEGFRRYFALLGIVALFLTVAYLRATVFTSSAWGTGFKESRESKPGTAAPAAFVLLFDELSYEVLLKDGRLDAEAFPNLAAQAEKSAWFTNATSNHRGTLEAVPSMLTGRLNPDADDRSFFRLLPEGLDVFLVDPYVITENWVRQDAQLADGIYFGGRARLLTFRPLEIPKFVFAGILESPFFFGSAPEVPDPLHWANLDRHDWIRQEYHALLDLVRSPDAEKRLTYWHCSLPHAPYVFAADGSRHGHPDHKFNKDGSNRDGVWRNYHEQVRYVDRLIGGFFEALEDAGLAEKAVVVITSDHGLRTKGWIEPEGYPSIRSNLTPRIPLLIRAPGVKPGTYDLDYQQIDFAPTLLDLLGVSYAPDRFDGVSAFAPNRPVREKVFRKHSSEWRFDGASGIWVKREGPER